MSPAAEHDRPLLARMAMGEEAALGELYDRYSPMLYALAFRISGEPADAEEIVLDTFAQAWRDPSRFEAGRGSVIAWLTMICRSRALDLVRSRGRRAKLASSAAAAAPGESPAMGRSEGTSEPLERSERCQVVADALGMLPPPQRKAIELAYWEGLSQAEIADRLGEPLGTVKTRVRTGMQTLREALRPYYFEQSS